MQLDANPLSFSSKLSKAWHRRQPRPPGSRFEPEEISPFSHVSRYCKDHLFCTELRYFWLCCLMHSSMCMPALSPIHTEHETHNSLPGEKIEGWKERKESIMWETVVTFLTIILADTQTAWQRQSIMGTQLPSWNVDVKKENSGETRFFERPDSLHHGSALTRKFTGNTW